MKTALFTLTIAAIALFLGSCAGERQGLVCEEIEYRLNTMTYSPDQRAYMEDELQSCREEEAQKKGASAESRKSIYDRFAASDTAKATANSNGGERESAREVSVSEALKDSSGEKTQSIYDRYSDKSQPVEGASAEPASETAVDTSASDISNFQ